jgi:bifunctional oligoribonuclease and PAP phosphatase NrnA
MNNSLIEKIGRQFRTAQRILVVSHIRPDGDAVGSLLGLGLSLQAANKEVQMVLSDGVPTSFRHLVGSDQVRYSSDGEFDLVCVVDCSDLPRVGSALNGYSQPDLNIDHHVTNLNFATINLVDTKATATAEILSELIPAVGLPMSQAVASALLTGMITDTLGFRTSNMTPKALRLVAELMEQQVNYPELYRRALISRSFEAARFWGAGLSRLQRDGRLVWTTLTIQDRKAANYPGRDDADLVNILSSIDDADVAVIFVEQPDERIKVSWRSQPGFDVSPIALSFGGGGHPSASGADVEGEMEEVKSNVLRATRALLEREEVSLG